jgi:hypothetical protein
MTAMVATSDFYNEVQLESLGNVPGFFFAKMISQIDLSFDKSLLHLCM